MIASLHGHVEALLEDALIVRVGDVGYAVRVARSLLVQEARVGQKIDLWAYTYVRENEISLYGFETLDERELFLILRVSGIGARTALAILSTFAPETLRVAIAQGDAAALTRIPGIGRKTAQRLLLDLKDKIGLVTDAWLSSPITDGDAEAINALTALGYSLSEAQEAVASVPREIEPLDERILAALRLMGRG